MFRAIISPIIRSTRLCLQLVLQCWSGHQQAASSVIYTTSCKHGLALLRMEEIISRIMLSWLKLFIIKLLLLYLVGCLYYCISHTQLHKYQKIKTGLRNKAAVSCPVIIIIIIIIFVIISRYFINEIVKSSNETLIITKRASLTLDERHWATCLIHVLQ